MGFLGLYCKLWKVIKAWVQAFNIVPPFFGHNLVTVFQWSHIFYCISNVYVQ